MPDERKTIAQAIANQQTAWRYQSKSPEMKESFNRLVVKCLSWMLDKEDVTADDRTISVLQQYRDIIGEAVSPYKSTMAQYVIDNTKVEETLIAMHNFIDHKKGKTVMKMDNVYDDDDEQDRLVGEIRIYMKEHNG